MPDATFRLYKDCLRNKLRLQACDKAQWAHPTASSIGYAHPPKVNQSLDLYFI